jgi:tetratricopeptide (TPR) repeat protein
VDLFRSADPYGPAGSDLSARDVLKSGAERVDRELMDDPELQARMLAEMGWSFDGLGEYDRASRLLERSVELYRAHLGDNDERTLRAMQYLGKVYYRQERPEDAEAMFRGVVAGFEANLGPGHRRTLGSRLYLPEEMIDAGRYDDAILELEPVLADQVEMLGASDQDTLFTGVLLATALSHSGRKDETAPLIDAALAGLQLADDYDDGQAIRMMRLGWVCLFLGRLEDSEQVYRRVLDRREIALGQDHPQALQTRSMLASILSQQGRHDESTEESQVILEVRARVLGADHPDTLQTLSLLGDSLIDSERYTEAEEVFLSAVEGYERVGQKGFWPARTKLGLGRAIRLNGRLEEALTWSYQVQEYCDAELSDRHPVCNGNLRDIGHILQRLGDEEGVARIRTRLNALKKTK